METKTPEWITLDANQSKVMTAQANWNKIQGLGLNARAANRGKLLSETAAEDGLSVITNADSQFIDLAIHKDTFLDDAAIQRDVTSANLLFWKSQYAPVTGVHLGSVYGGPAASFYAVQQYYGTAQPIVVESDEIDLPNMSLSMNVDKLGLRDMALTRVAEQMKIRGEQILLDTMLGQPIGTPIASAIANYVSAGNPYNGRTVYVIDPGVQSGTYETSNIISMSSSAGLSPALAEAIVSQMQLMKRTPKTVHIPVAGQPWRKLFRYSNVGLSVNAPLTGPGNTGLNVLAPSQYEQFWTSNFEQGFVINWWGMPLRFKTNNAMPAGYGIITTDQPAAEIVNVTDLSVTVDFMKDPKQPYFSRHYEKRVWGVWQPDPWIRNFLVIYFGATSGL